MKYNKSMAQILADMNENAIEEGKMKQLAMMIKQKKSPEQIAKALKVDVKTIKSLMGEQEGEGPQDPIDQAKKKIDKIKKIAVLKKQMADIQKSEDTDVEEGIKPYVSMMRDNGKMKYRVLDKDEKEILVTTDSKKAEDFFKKNYNKLRAGSAKPVKEETDLEEFTDKQIERLRKEYMPLKGKETGINPDKFKKLRGMMKRFPKANLLKLVKADIPVLTTGAKAALVMYHGMKWKQLPEDFLPYVELFAEEVDEQKGKFKSIDPKVLARISNMMRGSKEEKQSLANMLNYFMPPEVVDMVRDKFGIKMPRGKIKFTDL